MERTEKKHESIFHLYLEGWTCRGYHVLDMTDGLYCYIKMLLELKVFSYYFPSSTVHAGTENSYVSGKQGGLALFENISVLYESINETTQ